VSTRLDLLKNFWEIITSDGEIHPDEESFFIKIAQSMGYKLDSIEDIPLLQEISPSKNIFIPIEERISNIYGLALMMKIDGKIHKKEVETIRNIGIEMGLPVDSLNTMLEILFENRKKFLTAGELKQIFSISNN